MSPLHGVATDTGHEFAGDHPRQNRQNHCQRQGRAVPVGSVNRQFKASRPNVRWLSEFTYVATWTGFVYVAFVIDAYARRVAAGGSRARRTPAWCSTRWSRHCMIDGRSIRGGLVHHSDRGSNTSSNTVSAWPKQA